MVLATLYTFNYVQCDYYSFDCAAHLFAVHPVSCIQDEHFAHFDRSFGLVCTLA